MKDKDYQPDWFSKPGDTLAELMARKGLTVAQLSESTELSKECIAQLLAGARPIDDKIAEALAPALGSSSSFWKKRQAAYDNALERAAERISPELAQAWLREFSHKQMSEYGLRKKGNKKQDLIKTCLAYFGVANPDEWRKRYADYPADVVFRTTSSFETKMGALSLWLRQGELRASAVTTARWDSSQLRDQIANLRRLSKRKSPLGFAPELRAICAAAGVAIVFVRAPTGCRASGASRFIGPNKAMVVVSFRHLSDDHFWFTFFHEIGHLLLHGKDATFVDGDETARSDREKEANAFAACALIPLERHEELLSLSPKMDPVVRFAVSVGVAPGIVVGQLQHSKIIGQEQLNFLKRRFAWEEVSAAFA